MYRARNIRRIADSDIRRLRLVEGQRHLQQLGITYLCYLIAVFDIVARAYIESRNNARRLSGDAQLIRVLECAFIARLALLKRELLFFKADVIIRGVEPVEHRALFDGIADLIITLRYIARNLRDDFIAFKGLNRRAAGNRQRNIAARNNVGLARRRLLRLFAARRL